MKLLMEADKEKDFMINGQEDPKVFATFNIPNTEMGGFLNEKSFYK